MEVVYPVKNIPSRFLMEFGLSQQFINSHPFTSTSFLVDKKDQTYSLLGFLVLNSRLQKMNFLEYYNGQCKKFTKENYWCQLLWEFKNLCVMEKYQNMPENTQVDYQELQNTLMKSRNTLFQHWVLNQHWYALLIRQRVELEQYVISSYPLEYQVIRGNKLIETFSEHTQIKQLMERQDLILDPLEASLIAKLFHVNFSQNILVGEQQFRLQSQMFYDEHEFEKLDFKIFYINNRNNQKRTLFLIGENEQKELENIIKHIIIKKKFICEYRRTTITLLNESQYQPESEKQSTQNLGQNKNQLAETQEIIVEKQKPPNFQNPLFISMCFNELKFSPQLEVSLNLSTQSNISKIAPSIPQEQQIQIPYITVNRPMLQNLTILPTTIECSICCSDIYSQDLLILQCNHKVHEECLKQQSLSNFKEGRRNIKDYVCLNEGCKTLLSKECLFKLLPAETIQEIMQVSAIKFSNIFCPNEACNTPLFLGVQEKQDKEAQKLITCPKCQKKICNLCRQIDHGPIKENMKCPTYLNEINSALKGEAKGICPNCKLLSLKDEHCNKVECYNCKLEFCFVCNVHLIPIKAHGLHYHRVGCPDYRAWIDEETKQEHLENEFNDKACQYCKTNGKACIRPMPLAQFKSENPEWFPQEII